MFVTIHQVQDTRPHVSPGRDLGDPPGVGRRSGWAGTAFEGLRRPLQSLRLGRVMPFTPYDAGQDMVGRAQALIELAARLSRTDARTVISPLGGRPVRDDLRRLAIVVAVAALDTYMHRLVVSRAYSQKQMPSKLANVTVRFVPA